MTHANVGQPGSDQSRGKRLVTISADLTGSKEFMTIAVAGTE